MARWEALIFATGKWGQRIIDCEGAEAMSLISNNATSPPF
jgi:hypothetical protein